MKVKPLGDRILIKPVEAEEKTSGGIVIPDTAREKPQQAEVAAVGDGKKKADGSVIPLSIKEGDRVLYGKYSGTEITIEGQDYLIVKEEDILGIVT
ncbi:MAG: co-chaperone GroES [Candidatus Omnitrophica bacterium]|jgi:chaperonin GroES|nr:co-chaperone GroES [Candidatus Omnitrophota bacterium]MCF7892314.1 co-chaperone GroES [Candidatus Omnitrophota bacterium]MCF7895751.1 co-chaperone GroES [Candidatus Omnitrophota bacterium]MCF7897726.1 co-chaperone GroES [Candidatus Omnitrophota bacterium]MCF7909563.1 co-chaperone GroES [Candidatus Omnitrophota bacterium]